MLSAPRVRQSRRVSESSVSSSAMFGNAPYVSPNPNFYPTRSSSVSPQMRASRVKPSVDLSELPPVPRVPSIYNSTNNSPSSSSSSSPSPVLALSDSITGNGTLRGLASDPTLSKKSFPSNLSLKPPEPQSTKEEGKSDTIPVET